MCLEGEEQRGDVEQAAVGRWRDRPSQRDSVSAETSNMRMSKPFRELRRGTPREEAACAMA